MTYGNSPVDKSMFNLRFRGYSDLSELVYSMVTREAPKFIETVADGQVLDVGCGYGSSFIDVLKKQLRKPRTFVHLDADSRVFISSENISKQQRDERNAYWSDDVKVCADAHELPFRNETFDLVHMSGTLCDTVLNASGAEKFNRTKIQQEIHRVLKQGRFYFGDDCIADYSGAEINGFTQIPIRIACMALYQKK
ncbi:MAG TPA: class I SAM-dependent methyltransferase [Candidatus Nanoarchaeia archaeon]|nr:class I SAM-dependent methyltransferase [Candidatus Nanoarchaeia archaeon]